MLYLLGIAFRLPFILFLLSPFPIVEGHLRRSVYGYVGGTSGKDVEAVFLYWKLHPQLHIQPLLQRVSRSRRKPALHLERHTAGHEKGQLLKRSSFETNKVTVKYRLYGTLYGTKGNSQRRSKDAVHKEPTEDSRTQDYLEGRHTYFPVLSVTTSFTIRRLRTKLSEQRLTLGRS